jgi:phosphoribosylformylglycinamidine cyclo-ligase
MSEREQFTYRDAGVDIDAKMSALDRIKAHVKSTATPGMLSGIGGFGGLFRFDTSAHRDPVLVSSADGVGTKLKVAVALNRHDTVGQDLVNHCVDDILVTGARPLFFLDYIGAGKVRGETIEAVVSGLAAACRENGCSLVGGETAELPEMYHEGEYDLAGTIVGVVERDGILDGSAVKPGDKLVGLASNGLHTNGYTLVRKLLIEKLGMKLDEHVEELGAMLGDELLRVHRSYLNPVTALRETVDVHALAHITGGGFQDNIPRVLPDGVGARVDTGSWDVPPIFELIRREANLSCAESHRTFNMGVGMIAVVAADDAPRSLEILAAQGLPSWVVGEIVAGQEGVELRGS